MLLNTLLVGKISDAQKSGRVRSTAKPISDWCETLRTYLSEKVPTYMVPSYFMTISTFPLNSYGTIDRNSLPELSIPVLQEEDTRIGPTTDLERTIANIWKETIYKDRFSEDHNSFKSNGFEQLPSISNGTTSLTPASSSYYLQSTMENFPEISSTDNFYSLGGDSLSLVKVYRQYQSIFNFDTEALSIRSLFEQNTIAEQAKLLETITMNNITLTQWHTLHINEGNTF
jgi:hypothetical protein